MGVRTTVIFTDLTGSTSVFETLGNSKATKAVTQLTRWICDLFESRGGRVIKTLGDGVLAVFPDAATAIDAAVQMQRSHQKNLFQQPASERLPIRVGVATGEVEIVDGDCFGDAVNIASRLSDLSGPHEIWVNSKELDYSVRPNGVRFRLLGPINVRGRVEPCTVYQVNWRDDEPTDFITMQSDLDPNELGMKGDVLGRIIELSRLDQSMAFKSFELPIQIGRIRHCEFIVNDPRVSRTHARIEWRNGSIVLVDVSTYGTWIRFDGSGSDILLRREECVLHGRGEIALGASFSDISIPTLKFNVT
jgi:class 3 adenylate cyclase